MKGRIYSDQKCELCKSNFKWDGNTGLYCPNHPDQQATAKFKVMFRPKSEPQICRRFTNYDDAVMAVRLFEQYWAPKLQNFVQ